MTNVKKVTKEGILKTCEKCDCLILPDDSDQKCIRPKASKKNLFESSGDGDESSEGIVISPKCNETVKIYIRGGPCQEDSTQDKEIWTVHNTDATDTGAETSESEHVPPPKQRELSTTPSRTTPTQTADEDIPPKKKNICFRFCKKKKPDSSKKGAKKDTAKEATTAKTDSKEDEPPKPPPKCHKDCNTQTCPTGLKGDLEEVDNFLKPCPTCKKGAGCNTNTIIFPRDHSAGDGIATLENILRLEAKTHTRNMEDLMSELHRQKRDIHEVKDMLDMVMRAVREQLYMTAFGRGKSEVLEELTQRNHLQRKSNCLSIKSGGDEKSEKIKMVHTATTPPPQPPEKRKIRFFPWCK